MSRNTVIKLLQKHAFHAGNSFQPTGEELKDKMIPGVRIIQNIPYPSQWPNSFLDLYLHEEPNNKPLIVYFHGGGYCWGDKAWPAEQWYKDQLVSAGYNMAAYNYAFSPEFVYPVPVHQLNEGLKHLPALAKEYGFSAERMVFGGSSAGSQLSGQLANLVTSPEYAKEMGIQPAIASETLVGLLLGSGLFDTNRFDKTGFFLTDWLFLKCAKSYFAADAVHGNPAVEQANVLSHVTANFPPSYITDANFGSFPDQAEELAEKLQRLGVRCELNLYPRREGRLIHGYENTDSKCARNNMEKTLRFLASL